MSEKRGYTEEQMKNALKDVANGVPFKTAAKNNGVPRTTLKAKHEKKYKKDKKGPETNLSEKIESDIEKWILLCVDKGFPVTREILCDSVQKVVKNLKIKTSFKNGRPGYKWISLFLNRHPEISLRTAELRTKCRSRITQEELDFWFKEIDDSIKKENLEEIFNDPSRVFNCDESAFYLAPTKGQVLARKGQKNATQKCNNGPNETLTVLMGANAAGTWMPFSIVTKGRKKPEGMPDDWSLAYSAGNGWMTPANFYEYVANVFDPWLTDQKIIRPVALFLDGHTSHMTLQLSEFCTQHQIHLFSLYPHATHLIQPMDVGVFKPMKNEWKQTVQQYKNENQVQKITKRLFPVVFHQAVKKFTKENIAEGFEKSGIFPFSPIKLESPPSEIRQKTSAPSSTRSRSENDDSVNEKHPVLKFIEAELGKSKVCLFKKNIFEKEDETTFKMWKKLQAAEESISADTTSTSISDHQILEKSSNNPSTTSDQRHDFESSVNSDLVSNPVAARTSLFVSSNLLPEGVSAEVPQKAVAEPLSNTPKSTTVNRKSSFWPAPDEDEQQNVRKSNRDTEPFFVTSTQWREMSSKNMEEKERKRSEILERKNKKESKKGEKKEENEKKKVERQKRKARSTISKGDKVLKKKKSMPKRKPAECESEFSSKSNKQIYYVASDDSRGDGEFECFYCREVDNDREEEKCIRCTCCSIWVHTECADVDDNDVKK